MKMVVLSRHGVRSPTQSSETLESWSRKDWPEWPVKRGELTPRGAKLVTAMWEQERRFYARPVYCPQKVARSRDDSRPCRSGSAYAGHGRGRARGAGSGMRVQAYREREGPSRSAVPSVGAGYCALDPAVVRKEIPVGAIEGLEQSLSGPIGELAAILGPASPEFCSRHQLPEGCTVADVPRA